MSFDFSNSSILSFIFHGIFFQMFFIQPLEVKVAFPSPALAFTATETGFKWGGRSI